MVLELFDSAITYRGRYLSVLQPAPVLDLVVSDRGNPRALGYQYDQVGRLLQDAGGGAELVQHAHGLARTADAMVDRVAAAADPAQATAALPDALDTLADRTAILSDLITRRFFALLPAPRMVGMDVA